MRPIITLVTAFLCGCIPWRAIAQAPAKADAAFTGTWMTEAEIETADRKVEKRGIVWKIVNGGELIMEIANTEIGTLSTNPETWAAVSGSR